MKYERISITMEEGSEISRLSLESSVISMREGAM